MITIKWKKGKPFKGITDVLSALNKVTQDNDLKIDLAKFTKDMVWKRVKSGKGVDSDKRPFLITKAVRLKPLSKGYKRYRRTGIVEFKAKKYYKSLYEVVDVKINVGKPALGEFGAPDRSNLTLSGQLLDSMTFDIKKLGFVVLIPATKRRGESITNSQLAKYLSRAGRPFMSLTAGESRILKSRMKIQIQKKLRKLLRK